MYLTWCNKCLGFDLLFEVIGVEMDKKQGGTNHNRCAQTLVILHALTHPKVGHPDLLLSVFW